MKHTLLFCLCITFLASSSAFAEKSRIQYLAPSVFFGADGLGAISDKGLYVASEVSSYVYDIWRYSKAKKRFINTARVVMDYESEDVGSDLCSINDAGEATLLEGDKLYTFSYTGQLVSIVDYFQGGCARRSEFPDSYDFTPSQSLTTNQIQRLRQKLCQIPANHKSRSPEGRLGVTNLLKIVRHLPNKRALAFVSRSDIDWRAQPLYSPHHDSLVLLDLSHPGENYCVDSTLELSSSGNPEEACEITGVSSYSSTFFTYLTVRGDEQDLNGTVAACSYTLKQKLPAGQKSAFTDYTIQWGVSEYADPEIISVFRAPVSQAYNIQILINEGCGKVIQSNSSNPKLRTQFFGIGDFWCSHV